MVQQLTQQYEVDPFLPYRWCTRAPDRAGNPRRVCDSGRHPAPLQADRYQPYPAARRPADGGPGKITGPGAEIEERERGARCDTGKQTATPVQHRGRPPEPTVGTRDVAQGFSHRHWIGRGIIEELYPYRTDRQLFHQLSAA